MKAEDTNASSLRLGRNCAPSATSGILTVSQLTALVREAIQSTFPATVHVVGEISNLKRHSSGHLYLKLKDAFSELACVMWRSEAGKLKFAPKDGLEVVASGSMEVFERAGRYQLYVRKLEPRGVGALELALRQLCEKLQKEGLFDPKHKKPLPIFPRRIAIVTSPTGAAVADLLRTIERRYPCVEVLLYPVRVQGDAAAAEIASAVRSLGEVAEQLGGIDVMIVGRGGGSLEDLWAFNEEIVARAIFASGIPIISAVGHEVDVTISDLVADVRAATPTAAAELAVPLLEDVLGRLQTLELRVWRRVRAKVELGGSQLSGVLKHRPLQEPTAFLRRREQILDELTNRTQRTLATRFHGARQILDTFEPIVQRIAPHTYLLRTGIVLRDAQHALQWSMSRWLSGCLTAIMSHKGLLDRTSPAGRVQSLADQVARLGTLLPGAVERRLAMMNQRLAAQEALLAAVSHQNVLARGFSITRVKKGRMIVRSVADLTDRLRLVTQVSDGEFESEALNIRQRELFE